MLVNAPCLNNIKSQNPLTVRLPNGATMESPHTAALDIPYLNKAASIVHVFPGMANHSLLSVGQLCNEGYTVTFKNALVTICDPQEFQILSGARDLDTGVNPSGKAGAQIPQLPLGDNSSPWGDNAICT
jgi:hypothetical protein